MHQLESTPGWLTARGGVDETEFCREFYMKHYIVYQDGAFFSPMGRIADEGDLRQMIYRELRDHITSGVAAKVESIISALRYEAAQTCLPEDLGRTLQSIPVHNGTYHLFGDFIETMYPTRYRLPVDYNPQAEKPERWLRFLSELLYEEDIPTLQEYMGYCLIPTTIAQKMLIITGRGGEGKSRIGVVMKALLGINMNLGSLAKVEKSPFARADLQHILLMVDDDLKMEALDQTNYLKSIITAELPMDLERKGIQSYQGKLNVRFLAFGNSSLQALHDRSHGFFRRQILLEARERPRERKDDPLLAAALLREREGILLWAIEGLERLTENDYAFTMSRRARDNLLRSMEQSNSAFDFMNSRGYIRFAQEESISFRQLYEIYLDWCTDNGTRALSRQSFAQYLNQNQQSLGITYSRTVPLSPGRRVRGYQGIAPA